MPASQNLTAFNPHFASQQLDHELFLLQSKQQQLKNRLTALLNQQLQESFSQYAASRSALSLPSSLDMIIFGLREELERVNALLNSLQYDTAFSVAA